MKRILGQIADPNEPHRSSASLGYYLSALLALVAVTVTIVHTDTEDKLQAVANLRGATTHDLAGLAGRLQSDIIGNIKLAGGLAATIAVEPAIDQQHFSAIAAKLFETNSQLRGLSAAPDLVIRFVYPFESNRAALGHDFRTDAEQRRSVFRARDSRSVVLNGPVRLVQGGTALIARLPVFTRDETGAEAFWGTVSAAMDLEKLYASSGLSDPQLALDVAITCSGPDKPDVTFYGNPAILDRDPVTFPIAIGDANWVLAAVPRHGWQVPATGQSSSHLAMIVLGFFVVAPLLWAGRLAQLRQDGMEALKDRESRLSEVSSRLQLALDASQIGVWEYVLDTGEIICDARIRQFYNVDPERGACDVSDWHNALHPDDSEEVRRRLHEALKTETGYHSEFRLLTPDGGTRHIRACCMFYRDAKGRKRVVGANWDVTQDLLIQAELRSAHALAESQNRQLEEVSRTLAYQSMHDALTDLPNRRYFDFFIEHNPELTSFSFLHVDLDHFKAINDTLGHAAGDKVLRIAAVRMRACLIEGEFVARIGGDEFIIASPVANPVANPAINPDERAHALAERLLTVFSGDVKVGRTRLHIGISIGAATQAEGGIDSHELLLRADIALYEAKRLGRNRVSYFDEAMRPLVAEAKGDGHESGTEPDMGWLAAS